ncbi:MAG: hypothetical protein H6700_03465 [Myxococcales bacterium]|nr:hypothetical protein [Myxococcales bacterium]MCB9530799.1 hypothetical protein [Myxococcales bacterium]
MRTEKPPLDLLSAALVVAIAACGTGAAPPVAAAGGGPSPAPPAGSVDPAAPVVAEAADRSARPADAAQVTAFGDGFDGESLDGRWEIVNGELADIAVGQGELTIRPLRYSVWFHAEAGPGVVTPVTGDFAMTTRVRARSTRTPDRPVASNFQFGGLIARDPASRSASSSENYVFTVVGYRGDYLSAETKSTDDDLSTVDGPPWSSGDAELRLCRVGDDFHLLIREIGATRWTDAITYRRSDLPATLDVGPIAYTYTDDVDLTARFDFVELSPVSSVEDCRRSE